MKISHGQLELFRFDPNAFTAQRATRPLVGKSMFRMWQYSLKKLHSENLGIAATHLQNIIHSNFKINRNNEKRLDDLIFMLYQYADAFSTLGNIALEVLKPISLVISPKLTITGEITRLDLVPTGGYAAFLLSRDKCENWQEQIRFPLIQAHFAIKLNCQLQDVSVGIYSIPEGKHEIHRYTVSHVNSAQNEITTLASRLL